MTFEQILALFENPKKSGDGFVARCPAHDDRNPSLSIAEGDDGKTLLNCHAGCVEFIEPFYEEQVGKLLDDREGIRDAAGPHRVPDAVNFGFKFACNHMSAPNERIYVVNGDDFYYNDVQNNSANINIQCS